MTRLENVQIRNDRAATVLGRSLVANTHLCQLEVVISGKTSKEGIDGLVAGLSKSNLFDLRFVHEVNNYSGAVPHSFLTSFSKVSTVRRLYWIVNNPDNHELRVDCMSANMLCQSFVNLRYLEINGNISASILSALGLALAHNTSILALKLQDMTLNGRYMEFLWPHSLCMNHTITTLSFVNCQFNDSSVRMFCFHWSPASSITKMDLSGNLIRPSGAVYLLNHIKEHRPVMQMLSLCGNQHLDYEGLHVICANLKDNHINYVRLGDCIRSLQNEMHAVQGFEDMFPDDHRGQRSDAPLNPTPIVLRDNNAEHVIFPTLRRSVRRYDANTGAWVEEHWVYHPTEGMAMRARRQQERLIQRQHDNRQLAAASAINAVSLNPLIHDLDVTDNQFGWDTERTIEYHVLRNKYLRPQNYVSIPPQVWCIVFDQLSWSTLAPSLLFLFLTENPAFIH